MTPSFPPRRSSDLVDFLTAREREQQVERPFPAFEVELKRVLALRGGRRRKVKGGRQILHRRLTPSPAARRADRRASRTRARRGCRRCVPSLHRRSNSPSRPSCRPSSLCRSITPSPPHIL